MDCAYSVDIPPGMKMKMFFNYFELEDDFSCR